MGVGTLYQPCPQRRATPQSLGAEGAERCPIHVCQVQQEGASAVVLLRAVTRCGSVSTVHDSPHSAAESIPLSLLAHLTTGKCLRCFGLQYCSIPSPHPLHTLPIAHPLHTLPTTHLPTPLSCLSHATHSSIRVRCQPATPPHSTCLRAVRRCQYRTWPKTITANTSRAPPGRRLKPAASLICTFIRLSLTHVLSMLSYQPKSFPIRAQCCASLTHGWLCQIAK